MLTANGRSQAQWAIVKALFDQDRSLSVVRPRQTSGALLCTSAQFLRDWIGADLSVADVLRRQNDFDACLALTGDGPRYLLKKDMRGFNRFSTKLYYDNKFTLLGLEIPHHGHTQMIFRGLNETFASHGCPRVCVCGYCLIHRVTTQGLLDVVGPKLQQCGHGVP